MDERTDGQTILRISALIEMRESFSGSDFLLYVKQNKKMGKTREKREEREEKRKGSMLTSPFPDVLYCTFSWKCLKAEGQILLLQETIIMISTY